MPANPQIDAAELRVTSKTEIADILGYANHSAVSKRLAHIRAVAERFFDQS